MSNFEHSFVGPINYYCKINQDTACWRNFAPAEEIDPDNPQIIHVPLGAIAISGVCDKQQSPLLMAELNHGQVVTVINRELNMAGVAHLPPDSDGHLLEEMYKHSPNLMSKTYQPQAYLIGKDRSPFMIDKLSEDFERLGIGSATLSAAPGNFIKVSGESGEIFINDVSEQANYQTL